MVGFNSNISDVQPYQNAGTQYTRPDKAAQTSKDAMQSAFADQKNPGAVYDQSDALATIVGQKTSSVLGRTVGQPQLSEKAQKYYDQLKAKFGDMDFILVSRDEKANAMANSASYANPNKPVVLIGEDEVEKMANDEKFREKYEGIIAMAKENLATMKDSFGDNDNVKGFGMQVGEDGEVSYFAVLKKANAEQAQRIQEHREEKRAADKAEDKKAQKEALEERIDKARSARSERALEAYDDQEDFGYEIIRAGSIDELSQKISAFFNPQGTEESAYIGKSVDFMA
jgi:hypothetical protein